MEMCEKSRWCRNEQVCQGVKCKFVRSNRLDTLLYKNIPLPFLCVNMRPLFSVDCNDSLYGHDRKYLTEDDKMADTLLEENLNQLKLLDKPGRSKAAATRYVVIELISPCDFHRTMTMGREPHTGRHTLLVTPTGANEYIRGFTLDNKYHNNFLHTQAMTSAILFESRNSILATIQDNWQCNLWLYIDSTKKGTSMLYNTRMFRSNYWVGWVF